MANVVFKRGSAVEIAAVPVTDGYILWDTTNNIIYMDNGTRRLVFGVGGVDGIRPVEYGGTGGSTPADAAAALLVDSLDASPLHVTANADLDNYTTAGVYSCATVSVSATVANNPWTTGTFTLVVRYIESDGTLLQWLIGCCADQDSGCGWFFRARINGTFYGWQAVNTQTEFDVTGETLLHTDATGKPTASNALNADVTINGTVTAQKVDGAKFADLRDVVICDTIPETVTVGKWYAVKDTSSSGSGSVTTGTVQLPVTADDFNLISTWNCTYALTDDGYFCDQSTATTATRTVTFNFSIPAGATVTGATVHSSWGGTLYGADVRTVAGQSVSTGESTVTVTPPAASATSMDVVFAFKATRDNYKSHWVQGGALGEWTKSHSSGATIKDVYLQIEYTVSESTGTSTNVLTPYTLYRA